MWKIDEPSLFMSIDQTTLHTGLTYFWRFAQRCDCWKPVAPCLSASTGQFALSEITRDR